MKKLLAIIALTAFFTSCEKEDQQCPVVKPENVPSSVADGFNAKYTGTTVETWFSKDGMYVAAFEINGEDRFAKFDGKGSFQSEFKEDDGDYDNGCECEEEDDD